MQSLINLTSDMHAGKVDILLILSGNPAYATPVDLGFREAMQRVRRRIHHSLYFDETSFDCHWHIPEPHYLETWSDIRAFDGIATIMQPLIAPLYQSKSVHQLMSLLLESDEPGGMDAVRNYWRGRLGSAGFEGGWQQSLQRGVVPDTAAPSVRVEMRSDFLSKPLTQPAAQIAGGYELGFRHDPTLHDGRYSNNGWLQELPKPLIKLTWDNAVLMSPAMAKSLELVSGQMVVLRSSPLNGPRRELEAPVWITPAQPEKCMTLYVGHGRTRSGRVGTKTAESGGFNAFVMQSSAFPRFEAGIQIVPTSRHYALACTQPHQMIESPLTEDLVRSQTIDDFRRSLGKPQDSKERRHVRLSLLSDYDYSTGHRWAMQIDNNVCIGCNACVVACQSENNIPVVGKDQVLNSREMHWIRIDTYFQGEANAKADVYFEPVPCMHCEKAPCELVCPVAATSHSAEGLNEMTYNRCIGTRYCSNNCPYKVRRFNFFQYAQSQEPLYLLGRNPEVTVRERGVMEKCTYCVQRLNRTRIEMKKLQMNQDDPSARQKADLKGEMDRHMRDLQTACQQACPTQAIIFGDLNYQFSDDKGATRRSDVAILRDQPHDFGLLEELNTQPRTRYLYRFHNPNPALGGLL